MRTFSRRTFMDGLLVLALLAVGPSRAADESAGAERNAAPETVAKKTAEKGPVRLQVSATPAEPTLSDLVTLRLEVTAKDDVEVTPPPFGGSVGEFSILDYREEPSRVADGATVRTFVYELEPMRAGRHLIRSVEISFIDNRAESEAKGQRVRLQSDPLEIEVSSAFAGGAPDLANLEPMAGPRPLPGGLWSNGWVWLGIAVVVALLVLVALRILRRKEKAVEVVDTRTPEEIAYAELMALREARLPEAGEVVEFYVRLTGIVRAYIERVTGIHAPEQTTEEFLRAMKRDARFDPLRAEQLQRFLEGCDLVKYAAQRPDAAEVEEVFSRAQDFVGLSGGVKLIRTAGGAPARAVAEPVGAGKEDGR